MFFSRRMGTKLVVRPAIETIDFSVGDFQKGDGWHVMDLSNKLPVGTFAFYAAVIIQANSTSESFRMCKNGLSGDENKFCVKTQAVGVKSAGQGIVFCDADRKIEYMFDSATWTYASLCILAWWLK